MFDFAEILFAQTKECRAVKFCIAPNVIIGVRMQLLAILVAPKLLCVVATFYINCARAPILLLALNKRSALDEKDLFAARGKPIRQRAASRAGADDDEIEVAAIVHAHS